MQPEWTSSVIFYNLYTIDPTSFIHFFATGFCNMNKFNYINIEDATRQLQGYGSALWSRGRHLVTKI